MLPRTKWPIWASFYVLLAYIVGPNFGCEEETLPTSVRDLCKCHNSTSLHCSGLRTTQALRAAGMHNASESPFQSILELRIDNSIFKCFEPEDFSGFVSLQALSVAFSSLQSFLCQQHHQHKRLFLRDLETLDLANNKLSKLKREHYQHLPKLRELNVSHNDISRIAPNFFLEMQLSVLDLSYNKLNEHIKSSVLYKMPTTRLKYLDISRKPKMFCLL